MTGSPRAGWTSRSSRANLTIGKVSSVRPSTNGLSQVVEVEPMADLAGVYVKVVMKEAPR